MAATKLGCVWLVGILASCVLLSIVTATISHENNRNGRNHNSHHQNKDTSCLEILIPTGECPVNRLNHTSWEYLSSCPQEIKDFTTFKYCVKNATNTSYFNTHESTSEIRKRQLFCMAVDIIAIEMSSTFGLQIAYDLLSCRADANDRSYLPQEDSKALDIVITAFKLHLTYSKQLRKICQSNADQLKGKYSPTHYSQRNAGIWISICLKLSICGNPVDCFPEYDYRMPQNFNMTTFNGNFPSSTRDAFHIWRAATPNRIVSYFKNVLNTIINFKIRWGGMEELSKDVALCYVYVQDYISGFHNSSFVDSESRRDASLLNTTAYALKKVFNSDRFSNIVLHNTNAAISNNKTLPLTGALLNAEDSWNIYSEFSEIIHYNDILKMLQNDLGIFVLYCSDVAEEFQFAGNTVTQRAVYGSIYCLRAYCTVMDCDYFQRHIGLEILSIDKQKSTSGRDKYSRGSQFLQMSLNETSVHCTSVVGQLIFLDLNITDFGQLIYDFHTCLSIFHFENIGNVDAEQYEAMIQNSKTPYSNRLKIATDSDFLQYNNRIAIKKSILNIMFGPSMLLAIRDGVTLAEKIDFNIEPILLQIQSVSSQNQSFQQIPDTDKVCPRPIKTVEVERFETTIERREDNLDSSNTSFNYVNQSQRRTTRSVSDYSNKHFFSPPLKYPDFGGSYFVTINEINTAVPNQIHREFIEYRKSCFGASSKLCEGKMTGLWTINVRGGAFPAIYSMKA